MRARRTAVEAGTHSAAALVAALEDEDAGVEASLCGRRTVLCMAICNSKKDIIYMTSPSLP